MYCSTLGDALFAKKASLSLFDFKALRAWCVLTLESFGFSRIQNGLCCLLVGLLHKQWAVTVQLLEFVKKRGPSRKRVSPRESSNVLHRLCVG